MAVEEMPAHSHAINRYVGIDDYNFDGSNDSMGLAACDAFNKAFTATGSSGASAVHNNIQPVKATYAWLRTA